MFLCVWVYSKSVVVFIVSGVLFVSLLRRVFLCVFGFTLIVSGVLFVSLLGRVFLCAFGFTLSQWLSL